MLSAVSHGTCMQKEWQLFATDKLVVSFLYFCRYGNSEPSKFSLPVSLLAHTFKMFILERYAFAFSAGGFVMIM